MPQVPKCPLHRAFGAIWLSAGIWLCTGCGSEYDRSTPESTVAAMSAMIQSGDVDQLPSLIYAEDPRIRELLAEIGPILDRIESLARTINERFPTQVATIRDEVTAAAADRAGQAARSRNMDESLWESRIQLILADPFKNFEEQLARVSVVEISSDMYAIQVDGKPAFGVGLIMRKMEDGLWYVEWPTNIPGMSRFMPQTDAEWTILRSILKSVTKGVAWTEDRIDDENLENLNEVMRQAQEEIFPPVIVGAGLYMRAIEMRPNVDNSESTPDSGSSNHDG